MSGSCADGACRSASFSEFIMKNVCVVVDVSHTPPILGCGLITNTSSLIVFY